MPSLNVLMLTWVLLLPSCNRQEPEPPAAAAPPAESYPAMLDVVNQYRRAGCRCGSTYMPPVTPLQWDARIGQAAGRHAVDMARNRLFDHRGSDGSDVGRRLQEAGFRWIRAGENIAWGYPSVTTVMDNWMRSESHCRNIMSADYTHFGAARSGTYWVQDFAK